MMSGGREGGRVKKCFLGLRQTALLSAEGKYHDELGNVFKKGYLILFRVPLTIVL
jgi:hypothetical protein